MLDWLRNFLDTPEGPVTLGALGGFAIRVGVKIGKEHPRQMVVSFVAAIVFAFFAAPAVAEYFELGPRAVSALSVLFGLTAPDIARGALRISDRFAATGKVPSVKSDEETND